VNESPRKTAVEPAGILAGSLVAGLAVFIGIGGRATSWITWTGSDLSSLSGIRTVDRDIASAGRRLTAARTPSTAEATAEPAVAFVPDVRVTPVAAVAAEASSASTGRAAGAVSADATPVRTNASAITVLGPMALTIGRFVSTSRHC